MSYINTSEFRLGLKIVFNQTPYTIIENEFVNPGKGQSFNRVKLRNIVTNKVIEKTFKSGDSLKIADVVDINLIYLYKDSNFWYFINNKTYDQYSINNELIGKNSKWLTSQTECNVTFWNKEPISLTLPNFVYLKVMQNDLSLKGITINSNIKLVKLITGTVIKVPKFIQVGDIIKIDTRFSKYISRNKN